jgi:hypothetical protein
LLKTSGSPQHWQWPETREKISLRRLNLVKQHVPFLIRSETVDLR